MIGRRIVAVVPFGARGTSPTAGAWARQLARRLVDRFARDTAIELRPVFLVAMPESASRSGYLVFGSSPAPELAAEYASSIGASCALTATYREEGEGRSLAIALVDAASRAAIGSASWEIDPGTLQLVEPRLARWLVETLGVQPSTDVTAPATASEAAYAALLEAMDHEVNATLLRPTDPTHAEVALDAALQGFVAAARLDVESAAPEERILVLAAESLERGSVAREIRALEELVTLRPRAWRVHYLLGQLRAESGDPSGAIVAFEHAHSLHPLPETDIVRLAELYANAGAPAPALAHLRRVAPGSPAYGAAQELLAIIAFQRGDLEAGKAAYEHALGSGTTSWELHASHGAALHARGDLEGSAARYRDALAAGAPAVVRLNLARVLLARGEGDAALAELETLLAAEQVGEVAGQARRLRFGLRESALERELERAGQAALAGEAATLDGSRDVFERALAVDPDLWEARFGLGIVARQRGDAAAAQEAFRRVLELRPDQPDALHELGVALLMGDRTGEALGALDRAAALRPDEPAYVADAGFAHLRAGDLETARRQLEHASHLDANDPITRSYVGELERALAEAGKRR